MEVKENTVEYRKDTEEDWKDTERDRKDTEQDRKDTEQDPALDIAIFISTIYSSSPPYLDNLKLPFSFIYNIFGKCFGTPTFTHIQPTLL